MEKTVKITKRKSVSKKVRFEVFKRDKFTCQYCGRSAPDVVLELDHVKPVAAGGENDILNYVTSCFDCNRGKGKTELDDNTAVQKQRHQMELLAERKEQLEMLIEWKEGLSNLDNDIVETLVSHFINETGYCPDENDKRSFKALLKQYSYEEVYDAMDISINQYFFNSSKQDGYAAGEALSKIKGICRNRRNDAEGKGDPRFYYVNYINKAIYRNGWYQSENSKRRVKNFVFSYDCSEEDFETIKTIISRSRNWGDFLFHIEDEFNYPI